MIYTTSRSRLCRRKDSLLSTHYVSLPRLQRLAEEGDEDALLKAQSEFEKHPIPFTLSEGSEWDGRSGQYLYWFDVWGEGIQNNEFRQLTKTDAQQDPEEWSFAVHRNNVRTNGGAAVHLFRPAARLEHRIR